jgi:hypothetical protein
MRQLGTKLFSLVSSVRREPRAISMWLSLRLPPIDHPQDLIALKAAAQESRVQPSVDSRPAHVM